jgi:D-glycerate 3-kinase
LPAESPHGFADWRCVSRVVAALARRLECQVIGVSGSQGSGKSRLSSTLAHTLSGAGVKTAACSIDDFYLGHQARRHLSRTVHPLLQTRGVPGTHDWSRLATVLETFKKGERHQRLPRFDKGLDDRVADQQIDAQLLVLEGWCVGVSPQPEALLASPCNELERSEDANGVWRRWVNRQIADHYLPLWRHVDLWVHLRVPGFEQVRAWRGQQEQQIPPQRRMSEDQIDRFIAHYERLTRWMWQAPAPGPGFVLGLDAQHNVAQFTANASPQIKA